MLLTGFTSSVDTTNAGTIQVQYIADKQLQAQWEEIKKCNAGKSKSLPVRTSGLTGTPIADIEDQLMPIIKDLPKRRCLVTSEEMFWNIAKVAGLNTNDNLQLDIATVEEIFNRLADVAYGTPAFRLGVPENREFAAAVLFLRELMHHAGFKSIILRH